MQIIHADFEHAGCKFVVREGTNDRDVIRSVFEGEYAVDDSEYEPNSVSIDVGAHLGAFSVWACKRYDRHQVLAVEPLPENLELLERNRQLNQSQIAIEVGAAGSSTLENISIAYNCEDTEGGRIHHFIGNAEGIKQGDRQVLAKRKTLIQLLTQAMTIFNVHKIWILKLDCESGEYPLITEATGSELQSIKWIVGEYHRGKEPLDEKLIRLGFDSLKAPEGHFLYKNIRHFRAI